MSSKPSGALPMFRVGLIVALLCAALVVVLVVLPGCNTISGMLGAPTEDERRAYVDDVAEIKAKAEALEDALDEAEDREIEANAQLEAERFRAEEMADDIDRLESGLLTARGDELASIVAALTDAREAASESNARVAALQASVSSWKRRQERVNRDAERVAADLEALRGEGAQFDQRLAEASQRGAGLVRSGANAISTFVPGSAAIVNPIAEQSASILMALLGGAGGFALERRRANRELAAKASQVDDVQKRAAALREIITMNEELGGIEAIVDKESVRDAAQRRLLTNPLAMEEFSKAKAAGKARRVKNVA